MMRPPGFLRLIVLLPLLAAATTANAVTRPVAACPTDAGAREALLDLKAARFELPAGSDTLVHAQRLLGCLSDPDPAIRDGVAYEALASWMREGDIDADGLRSLRGDLYGMLGANDDAGFTRPFAALVLAEVARTDRIKAWMTTAERSAMVDAATAYVSSITDYRGHDDVEGWRHGVAHGSDWLMQLAMNPALEKPQLDAILSAVATQVVPATAHGYVFGEPARLARPVLLIAMRGAHDDAQWQAWFDNLSARLGDPGTIGRDTGWLMRSHDLEAFLEAMYVSADISGNENLRRLKPIVAATMQGG